MNIAFVDSEHKSLVHVKKMFIDEFYSHEIPIKKVDVYSNSLSFLENWSPNKYDLILLDIKANDNSGLEIAKKIRESDKSARLVFFSKGNEFASESYYLNAMYYVRKPIDTQMVRAIVEKLDFENVSLRPYIVLKTNKRLYLNDIIYGEYHNHIIYIHTKQKEVIKERSSFISFLEKLSALSSFTSCSKGVFINMNEVKEKKGDVFIMSDGAMLPISRRRSRELEEIYDNFLFENLRNNL